MVAAQDIDQGSEIVVLPAALDIVDVPADSAQGLQPAREAAEAIPAKAIQETSTIAKNRRSVSPQS